MTKVPVVEGDCLPYGPEGNHETRRVRFCFKPVFR